MGIELVHFSIGKPKQMKYGEDKEMISGICKDSTEEAFLSKDGFLGDDVADLKHHGDLIVLFVYTHMNITHYGKRNSKQHFQLPHLAKTLP